MDLEGQRLRPLTEQEGCHPGGRASCPECAGRWSRATGGRHWVKGFHEGAGMPAPGPSHRLGMEEQACQAPGVGQLPAALPAPAVSLD